MYDCEICGRKTESLYIIGVESAQLAACQRCSAGKKILDSFEPEAKNPRTTVYRKAAEPEEEVVDNYGDVIRAARTRLGVPINVLAEMINEKESTLARVENGKMLPNTKLAKRLEKELGIKLTERPASSGKAKQLGGNEPITLGDAV